MSVTAGTIFQDSHLPLTTWFQVLWHVAGTGHRISALGLQRVLDLGSYKTAWAILHKLRRAMGRPSLARLDGVVEVDATYWDGKEEGVSGRLTQGKALIIVGVEAEEDGSTIGHVRLRRIPDLTKASLHGFIAQAVQPGSTVRTNGLSAYRGLEGYIHVRPVQRDQEADESTLRRVHRVIRVLTRWLRGTRQGAVGQEYLDDYLNEFTFLVNNRTLTSRGAVFYRLAWHAVHVAPAPFASLIQPAPVGRWRQVNSSSAKQKSK
jgi:transposase-like protein